MKMRGSVFGLLLFLGLLFAYAQTRGGFSGWFLFYGAAFFVVNALCVYGLSLQKLQVERHLGENRRFAAGDDLPVFLAVRHRSRIPLAWMIVEDRWVHCGSGRIFQHRALVMPGWRKQVTCRYTIQNMARGKYRFHSVRVLTGDLFGLAKKSICAEEAAEWIVQPKPMAVHPLPAGNGVFSGFDRGAGAEAAEIRGVRDYVHGDPANRIHWKSAARLQALRTKELERDSMRHMIVCLDAGFYASPVPGVSPGSGTVPDPGVQSGFGASPGSKAPADAGPPPVPGDDPAFEKCVAAAAGWLHYGMEHHFQTRLLCGAEPCGERRALPLPRKAALAQALQTLSEVVPNGSASIHALIRKEAAGMPPGALVVCATPALGEDWVHTAARLRRGRIGMILIHCVGERIPPWHERRWKERLEALGCRLYALPVRGGTRDVTA